MIDDLDFTFNCKHSSIGDILRNIEVSTGIIRDYRKGIQIANKFGDKLFVKSNNNGECFRVKTCAAKFLQGHNLFGSNNVIGIAYALVLEVTKALNIDITEKELAAIKRGEFTVNSTDIAWSYRVDANLIPNIIHEVGNLWRLQGKNVSNYYKESVYFNQHSKVLAFKLYDKERELGNNPLPANIAQRDKLLTYAKGLIRAELTLHSRALRNHGLTLGRNWSIVKVKEMMELAITQAAFNGSLKRKLMPLEVMRLKLILRQAYGLWASGIDLNQAYSSQTLRRHRNALLSKGIDIKQPPVKAIRTKKTDIARCFSEDNKCTYPSWAKDHGLIFLPKKVK